MAIKQILHTKALVKTQVREGVIEAVVGSTSVLDRMGDIIDQAGWELKNFKTNPVILWGHNIYEDRPPIGKAMKVWVEGKGKQARLMFQVLFDLQDKFAAEIYRKVKEGFVNTVSVGFLPLERNDNVYLRNELLELSFVAVPANQEALVELRSMGIKPLKSEKSLSTFYQKVMKAQEEAEAETEAEEPDPVEPEKPEESTEPEVETPVETPVEEEVEEEVETEDKAIEVQRASDQMKNKLKKVGDHLEMMSELYEKMQDEMGMMDEDDKKAGDVKKMAQQMKNHSEQIMSACDDMMGEDADKSMSSDEVSKSVIPYKDLGNAPETEEWDGPGEKAKAEVDDLKLMCAWFDSENAENKGSYKLPHHKAEGHKAVWRGVAAAMAALLGARGGASLPDADRKGVYNHLAKHYKDFGKEAPDFKMVEDQVLANFSEEIHALTLDREEKHVVRLIKKLTDLVKELSKSTKTKEEPKEPKEDPKPTDNGVSDKSITQADVMEALKIVQTAFEKALPHSN